MVALASMGPWAERVSKERNLLHDQLINSDWTAIMAGQNVVGIVCVVLGALQTGKQTASF